MANHELPYKINLSVEDANGNTVAQEFTKAGRSPMLHGPSTLDNSILMSDFVKAINSLLAQHPTLAQYAPQPEQ